jgi:hypothetical protein
MADNGHLDRLATTHCPINSPSVRIHGHINALLSLEKGGKGEEGSPYKVRDVMKMVEKDRGRFPDNVVQAALLRSFDVYMGHGFVGVRGSYDEMRQFIRGAKSMESKKYLNNYLEDFKFFLKYFELEGPDTEQIRDLLIREFPDLESCIRVATDDLGPKSAAKLD